MAEGLLPVRLAPNPHGSQFAPMRLIPLGILTRWLDNRPPVPPSPGARQAYSRTTPATRLRDVSSRLRSLADQRPWVTLLLLLLHWEAPMALLRQSEALALPVLWESTAAASEKMLWQGPSSQLIRFAFPTIGYAQFDTAWSPAGASPLGDCPWPWRSEGTFYQRLVGPREPARYPPPVLIKDLQTALGQFQMRWF